MSNRILRVSIHYSDDSGQIAIAEDLTFPLTIVSNIDEIAKAMRDFFDWYSAPVHFSSGDVKADWEYAKAYQGIISEDGIYLRQLGPMEETSSEHDKVEALCPIEDEPGDKVA